MSDFSDPARRRRRRARNERGYSLVEALIAVAILAGLAAAMAPAIHSAARAAGRVAAAAGAAESERSGTSWLAAAFSDLVSLPGNDAPALEGSPLRMRLVLHDGPRAAPLRAALSIRDGALHVAAAPLDGEGGGPDRTAVLVDGVVRFRYFGAARAGEPPAWRDDWRAAEPPRMVRIETTGGAGPRALDYHIAARAPVICVFDQVTRKCR